MRPTPDRPPAFWLALVRALLPTARRDEVEGDLIEGWCDRADRSYWRRAWAFWRDAASVIVRRRGVSDFAGRRRSFDAVAAGMVHDIRTTVRTLRRRPVFAALVVTVLATGIGASTAAFAIADRVLFRRLPFHEPDRIVALGNVNGLEILGGRLQRFAAIPEVSALGAYYTGSMNAATASHVWRARVAAVSPGFFEVFGVFPVAGRAFARSDDPESLTAVVSFRAWTRYFGGSPEVAGQTLRLNSRSYTVVGVMPRRFQFPDATDIWIPGLADTQASGTSRIQPMPAVVARLAAGVTSAQAAAAFTRADEGRYTRASRPATATPLQDHLTTYSRSPIATMTAVVILLLAATSASAAGLLLVRLRERERELVIRSALGAGRWRLTRPLIIECLILTGVGGSIGLLVARNALGALAAAIGQIPGVPLVDADLGRMDLRVALVGLAICALTGLLFAVGPALAASRANATRVLRKSRGSAAGPGSLSRGLVVAQMAVALMLLTVTSATIATVARLARVDLGFSNMEALVFDLTLPEEGYRTRTDARAFVERFAAEMQRVPGIRNMGATNVGPIWVGTPVIAIGVRPEDSGAGEPAASTPIQLFATPGYFRAMGIGLVAGRTFTAEEGESGARPAVILSEAVARSLDERPAAVIGRRVRLGSGAGNTAEVIGVVRDVKLGGVNGLRDGQLYEPLTERRGWFDGRMSIAIDSASSPAVVVDAARAVLNGIDPDLTPYNVVPVRDLGARYLPTERLTLAVTSLFSTIALVLCAVGLYGVLSQVVASRTREVGIRIALGADVMRVRRSVIAAGLRLAVAGVGIGIAGAFLAFKAAAAILPRQEPPSALMFALNALVLLTVALVAAWAPARRAAAVDPIHALKAE